MVLLWNERWNKRIFYLNYYFITVVSNKFLKIRCYWDNNCEGVVAQRSDWKHDVWVQFELYIFIINVNFIMKTNIFNKVCFYYMIRTLFIRSRCILLVSLYSFLKSCNMKSCRALSMCPNLSYCLSVCQDHFLFHHFLCNIETLLDGNSFVFFQLHAVSLI